MEKNQIIEIIDQITNVMGNSYSVYSGFRVGACVISDSGEKYFGVNVENKSYGLTICAERNAITTAVTNGMKKIKTIVVVADTKGPVTPCGACREVISEFADETTKIILANLKKDYKIYGMEEILPFAFQFDE